MADRWLPGVPADQANVVDVFARLYGGEPLESIAGHDLSPMSDPDTSIADYVWLPLRFEDDMVVIDWFDEWRVEDPRGERGV
jgi:hypothetical protein